jgi:hypothetical protein
MQTFSGRDFLRLMQVPYQKFMPQGHSHETTELKLLFLSEGLRIQDSVVLVRPGGWIYIFVSQ